MSRFVPVAKTADIPDGAGQCVEVEGRRIAIFHAGGQYYAIDDTCSHKGGPLSEGELVGTEVRCPWHGAKFSLETGDATFPPAREAVTCHRLRVRGEQIEIET